MMGGMNERLEPDGWSGVEAIMETDPWDHEGAPHGLPWPGTTRVPVSSVYADETQTEIVAVEDSDGCRALVKRIVSKRRVGI